MKNRIICECGTATVNPKGKNSDMCVKCYRLWRRDRYNPPVPRSRFDPMEFSSYREHPSDRILSIAETCRRSNELMKLDFKCFNQEIAGGIMITIFLNLLTLAMKQHMDIGEANDN